MAVTRALRFSDHVTKINGGSGDENGDGTFSTPELFSFAHDGRREELWGTLDQALSLFVVG